MKTSINLKILLAALALLLAMIALSLPFTYNPYEFEAILLPNETIANLQSDSELTGYNLIMPAYSLFFFVLPFILLISKRSGRFFILTLGVVNFFFWYYMREFLLSGEATERNDIAIGNGFHVLTVAVFLLIIVGILDFAQAKRNVPVTHLGG